MGIGRFSSVSEVTRYIQRQCLVKDQDAVCWFSGKRGSGKSTLGLLLGRKVDEGFEPAVIAGEPRITFDNVSFLRSTIPLQPGELADGDELSLFARAVMKGEQMALQEWLKDSRGRNLPVWMKFPQEDMVDEKMLLDACLFRFHCYHNHVYQVLVPKEVHLRDDSKALGNWREVFRSTFPDLPNDHPLKMKYRALKAAHMRDSNVKLAERLQGIEDKKQGKRSKARDPAEEEASVLPSGLPAWEGDGYVPGRGPSSGHRQAGAGWQPHG